MAALCLSPFVSISSSISFSTRLFHQNPLFISSLLPLKQSTRKNSNIRPISISFALTESDSAKSLDQEDAAPLLQELADSFRLPLDYLEKLPRDLRLDLNDAAFDLANGPVLDECGRELGEMLLNLSRAWELADTSTSCSIASKLPSVVPLSDSAKSAFGKRLVSAGRRFEGMGQYGQGELQRIAKAMVKAGKVLSARPVIVTDEKVKKESRVLKFGDLQVELTPERANIGAAIGFIFGILAWQLTQGIQSIPESSLEYANDNALLLAKSLRGALLAIGYSSTLLSAFAAGGLLLLARQLSTESESKKQ